jgi:hypothetical protein
MIAVLGELDCGFKTTPQSRLPCCPRPHVRSTPAGRAARLLVATHTLNGEIRVGGLLVD